MEKNTQIQKKIIYEKDSDLNQHFSLKRERAERTWLSRAHYHNAVELSIVLDGKNGCCINGDMNMMHAGDISFIDSFDVHYFDIYEGNETIAIIIEKNLLEDVYKQYMSPDGHIPSFPRRMNDPKANEKIIEYVIAWWRDFDHCTLLQHIGYINLVFGEIVRNYSVTYEKDEHNHLAVDILKYLNTHYEEELSLDKLAKIFAYSRNTVSRTIHSLLGQDLRTYVNKIRVEKAYAMIKENPKLTVQEAAFKCGFNSLKTFYRSYFRNFEDKPKIGKGTRYKADTLLIGASCFSVGYALSHENCLIIDGGQSIAEDFAGSMNNAPVLTPLRSTWGKLLVEDMKKRNLLTERGNVHILPLVGVLSKYVQEQHLSVLLETQFLEAVKKGDGWLIRVFGRNGREEFFVRRIVDTRDNEKYAEKFLSVSITGNGEEYGSLSKIRLQKGALGETVLQYTVDRSDDLKEAKRKVENVVLKNVKSSRICAYANRFGYRYKNVELTTKDEGYYTVPSAGYENFLAAFEAGVLTEVEK